MSHLDSRSPANLANSTFMALVISMPRGAVVIDRLRRVGEPPRTGFDLIGRVALLRAEGIRLEPGSDGLELTDDGEVQVNRKGNR